MSSVHMISSLEGTTTIFGNGIWLVCKACSLPPAPLRSFSLSLRGGKGIWIHNMGNMSRMSQVLIETFFETNF